MRESTHANLSGRAKLPEYPGQRTKPPSSGTGEVPALQGCFLGFSHALYGLFFSWMASGEIVNTDSVFFATLFLMAALFNIVQIPAGFALVLGKPWAPRFIISTMEGYIAIMIIPFIVGIGNSGLVGSYDELIANHSTLLVWPMIIILLLGNSSHVNSHVKTTEHLSKSGLKAPE